jgi:excisionase family DNA binding protein
MNTETEQLIDAKEAAKILRIHPGTVREMAKDNRLPHLRIGRCYRFQASVLGEWISKSMTQGQAQ